MLEEGLGEQLEALARRIPLARQTLFFSATWPEEVNAFAERFCRCTPVMVRIDGVTGAEALATTPNITQRVEVFDLASETEEEREERKRKRLLELLHIVLGS